MRELPGDPCRDRLTYQVNISRARPPVQFTAKPLYQTRGYRFVEDLQRDLTSKVQRFASFYDGANKIPTLIAIVS